MSTSITKALSLEDEVRAEEVAAIFRTVTFAVLAAYAAASGMILVLVELRFAEPRRGASFAAYFFLVVVAHILLRRGYARDPARASRWRYWGNAFAAIALLEGIGWGATAFLLVSGQDFDAQVFELLVSAGVGVSSIPVFGPYPPAFLAFFLPIMGPFLVCNALGHNPLQRGIAFMLVVYTVAMIVFGLGFNRAFRRLVRLRMHAETLASKLSVQIEIAEAANRAKSSFLAAASHDLRQPVHAVALLVGALRCMAMPAEAALVIEQIDASSKAMDALFAALLDISRLDAGIVEANLAPFAIAPLLERIRLEYADEARGKHIALRVNHSNAVLSSDPILIERVLRNLVANAVRYTESGRVIVGCRRRGALLAVQIWDTGPGIPPDQRERIFEEYYQLGNAERDRKRGLGLGLAIVRRLTELLGCTLSLRTEVGRGSCFEVAIPIADAAALESEDLQTAELPSLRALTIVVIDDESDIRAAMSLVLEGWGHRVLAVASAAEAIEQLHRSGFPDLIIADFRLRDGEDGIVAIEAIRRECGVSIPAMLITGDTAPERLVQSRDGGIPLLHKPVSNGRLRAAIAALVAGATAGVRSPISEQTGRVTEVSCLESVHDVLDPRGA